jgi:PAS domain S-box-containing protein
MTLPDAGEHDESTGEPFRALVEHTGDLALLLDAHGVITYANRAAHDVLGVPPAQVTGKRVLELADAADAATPRAELARLLAAPGTAVRFEFRIRHAQGSWRVLQAAGTNRLHDAAVGAVVLTCRDITERRSTERRMASLNHLYAVLSAINRVIVRARDPRELFDEACRNAVEAGGFVTAWVGLLDSATECIEPVASAGAVGEHLARLVIVPGQERSDRGPTATALRTGVPVVCNDIEYDPRMEPWRDAAMRLGSRSMAAFPLRMSDRPSGVLCLYSSEPDFFDDQEVQILSELATEVAFAIQFIEKDRRRQEAEQSLRASEERYRSLFDNNPHPMWVYDRATLRFLAVNDAAGARYGYSKDEFLAMTIADIRPPEDVPALRESVAAVASGLHHAGFWRHRSKDGRVFLVEVTSHTMTFAGHDAELVLAIDVTERERAEAARRDSEGWLRAIFEQAAIGVAQVETATGRFVRVNQRYCDIIGYSREELEGLDFRAITHPDDVALGVRELERLQRTEMHETSFEKRYLRKDGTPVWVNLTVSAMWQQGAAPEYHVVVMQDISRRKVAEAQLAQVREHLYQVQKLESLGRLAGGIAHDLNNVLMPIMGYTQLLLGEFPEPGQVHDDLQEVYRAAERASTLVRQILAFSRKQVLQLEELDLNAVITNFGSMLTRLIGEHIELRLQLADDLCLVKADRSQLEQVVLNLAVNARDAMPRGGQLTIETSEVTIESGGPLPARVPPGRYARLVVRDTGEGMDAETREHVFEPFFTTKAAGSGTGLGLATVFGIVTQHEGHIAVESESGRGTAFTIWLAAAPPEGRVAEAAPPVVAAAPQARARVLVVEDDPSVRRFVSVALRSRGYDVMDVENADRALEITEREAHIDLLLTDVVMPGMNGHELYQQLAPRRPTLKVLFMSGYTDDVIADHGVLGSGVLLLQKPFAIETLLAKVREALAIRPEGTHSQI